MRDMGLVTGSEAQAKELIVNVDTVYVHTDITKKEETDEQGNTIILYEYHEIQYDKDEYIQLMAEKNATLEEQVTQAQEGMCELYEMLS